MKKIQLNHMVLMALCCSLGMVSKKLINPFANVITEILHIPGGVSTGFSIMFLVIAVELIRIKHCGIWMTFVQGFLALVLGRVGSMGILMPLSYISTGIAMDIVYAAQKHAGWTRTERMMLANGFASFMASFTANVLVFHLEGVVLWLYFGVSAISGMCYGFLGSQLAVRLYPIMQKECMVGGCYYENT